MIRLELTDTEAALVAAQMKRLAEATSFGPQRMLALGIAAKAETQNVRPFRIVRGGE